MFEVGFSEIVLIFAIALLVLGPTRLPKLAADIGRWAGRARAMARQLRTQLEQEVQFDPLAEDHARSRPAQPVPEQPQPNTIHRPTPVESAPVDAATPAAVSHHDPVEATLTAAPEPVIAAPASAPAPAPAAQPPAATPDERKSVATAAE